MSLQVWLPLNGNLNNYGVGTLSSDFSISSPAYSAGKTGNNLKISSQQSNVVTIDELTNKKDVTISFWFCPNSGNTFGAWRDVITFGVSNGTSVLQFRMEAINSTGKNFVWFGNNILTTDAGCCGYTLNLDTWYHITIVLDGTTIKKYIDGELQDTFIIPTPYANNYYFTGTMSLGDASMYVSLADVRIYDECLSAKQIKEIAKGLVAHYPLNSGYGNANLVPNVSQYTKLYPLVKTSALTDGWAWIPGTTFICEPSTTYTIQVRSDGYLCAQHGGLYQPSDKAFTFWLYICNEDTTKDPYNGGWDTPMCLTSANPSYIGHGNLHTWQYTTPWNAKYLSLRTNTYSNGTDETTVKFWDIKVEKGIKATLPVPNKADTLYNILGYNDTTIYNNANFENSLEKVGNLVHSSDTPLYDSSIDFNQTGYLKNSSFNLYADKMTVCFWVKIPETITAQHFLFSTHNNWPYNGVSMYRNNSAHKGYTLLVKSDSESTYNETEVEIDTNTWTFITIVYTGEQYKVYKNGNIYKTITYGSGGKVYNLVLYLGNSLYNGTPSSETDEASMSDFRIYASVLSETDIKRLYQSRAKIDKNGTLYCNQFIEDTNTKVSINSKGIVKANSFTEIESEKKCKIYKQNIQSTEIIEE